VITIRHRAWLASRLPPRLRRCRLTLPEEAGIGATAHGELPLLCYRLGLAGAWLADELIAEWTAPVQDVASVAGACQESGSVQHLQVKPAGDLGGCQRFLQLTEQPGSGCAFRVSSGGDRQFQKVCSVVVPSASVTVT
jgi:hypothetical protein